ncbi:hypothetical protein, partial [Serratia marcescens]|uniref:hypothetical protein n=1 Tax=Serratia marcescens TaxID=615 RepID=UPI001BD289C5
MGNMTFFSTHHEQARLETAALEGAGIAPPAANGRSSKIGAISAAPHGPQRISTLIAGYSLL